MILQSLYDYYHRKAKDSESGIAPLGMEWKRIPYIIVIDETGLFIRVEENEQQFLVCQGVGRSGSAGWQVAYVFWDHYGFVLGATKNSVIKKNEVEDVLKWSETARKQHQSFIKLVEDYCERYPDNRQFKAVSEFYKNSDYLKAIEADPLWQQVVKKDGTNLSFRLVGETDIVAEHLDLYPKKEDSTSEDNVEGICLITGKKAAIQKLHSGLTIPGGKAGAKLVGFQTNSGYDSYNKEQGFNAPVSVEAELAYNNALKTMLDKDSVNKYRIGDTLFLFWAKESCSFEADFAYYFSFLPKDDPDRNVVAIKKLMQSPFTGAFSDEEDTLFYLLGLVPNAARISVRSWRMGTIKDFADKIRQHFLDFEMISGSENQIKYYPLLKVFTSISLQYKLENLPPNLIGEVMKSILEGTPYPVSLQMHCINRIRADRSVSTIRASILKACLNRKSRFLINTNTIITMALDKENTNQAYLCGRLFAILEQIQEKANPGINSTIKDRYYAAASATPIAVFPRLMALKNHHLPKLNVGYTIVMEKLIGEVLDKIIPLGFPKHLSLDDQSRFAIGYYHQRQSFYISKEKNSIEQ